MPSVTTGQQGGGRHLSDAHRKTLSQDSSISDGVILARGYFTATTPEEIRALGHGYSEAQCQLVPCLVIPIWSVDREIVTSQIRPDNPREVDGKPLKYETPSGSAMRLDAHPMIADKAMDPAYPLWITEGAKKADSAIVRGVCCLSLAGVWNWRGRNEKGGITELGDWERIAIKGRHIYIAFDSDIMTKREVLAAMKRLAAFLRRRGARTVSPVVLPSKGGAKVGLDDFFARGGTLIEAEHAIEPELLESIKIVHNGRGLSEVLGEATQALAAANDPPFLFVRGGQLSRIEEDERGVFKVASLSAIAARSILADAAQWIKAGEKSESKTFPPKDIADAIVHAGRWDNIPGLLSLANAPVLAKCGTVAKRFGYDGESKYYITSRREWPEWEGDAASAAQWIFDEVLIDFPFAKEADRAHALALMLLPIVRPAISGPTPLHMIDAPVQGTGKSLLAEVCLMPTVGKNVAGASGAGKEEEEWRKKIISELLKGQSYIYFDNLVGKVRSAALAGAITSTQWTDRLLGTMTSVTLPVECVWVATGNNCQLDEDIVRRSVWIRLDAEQERPQDRMDFKHQNIKRFVLDNRGKIVSALLCMVTTWVAQGRPSHTISKLGSFEEWGNAVGGILASAGVAGFLGNIKELNEAANPADASWAEFYKRWRNYYGTQSVKASMLLSEFVQDETLAGFVGGGSESQQKVKLGYVLRRQIGIVRGGLRIARAGILDGSASYRLEEVEERGVRLKSGESESEKRKLPFQQSGSNEDQKGELGELGELENPLRACARAHTCAGSENPKNPPTPIFEPNGNINSPSKLPFGGADLIGEVEI